MKIELSKFDCKELISKKYVYLTEGDWDGTPLYCDNYFLLHLGRQDYDGVNKEHIYAFKNVSDIEQFIIEHIENKTKNISELTIAFPQGIEFCKIKLSIVLQKIK